MDFVHMFSPNWNAVYLQDLVSLIQEAAALRCPALYHTAYYHVVHVVTHCCTLLAESGVFVNLKKNASVFARFSTSK